LLFGFVYFFFFFSRCDNALAATDFSRFVDFGSFKIFDAFEATDLLVTFFAISHLLQKFNIY